MISLLERACFTHQTGHRIFRVDHCRPSLTFSVSWVWVKDRDLRTSLDHHVAMHSPTPFVHQSQSSNIRIMIDLERAERSQAIDLLRKSFEALLECLSGSPAFCESYVLSGPVGRLVPPLENVHKL